jgi:hypothetical protein
MARIELEIDELVLHGVDSAAAEALVASLRWEIARSLSEPSAHEALNRHRGPTEHHLTEPVVVRTGSSIDQLGAVTAQAILRGLSS